MPLLEHKSSQKLSPIKKRLKAAVLGASGLVGQVFVRLLADHPYFDLVFLGTSPARAGKQFSQVFLEGHPCLPASGISPLPERIMRLELQTCEPALLEKNGVQVVFSALPAAVAYSLERELRNRGLAVFTNSSALRFEKEIPVIIPEVNSDQLKFIRVQKKIYGGFILAGSNCCVAGATLALKPLLEASPQPPSVIRINTYQSLSGAGRNGLAAFDLAGNLIPWIPDEEEKISREIPKILAKCKNEENFPALIPIKASCVRVPVTSGHLLHIEVEWSEKISSQKVTESLKNCSGLKKLSLPTAPVSPIIIRSEPDRPQPALDLWAGNPATAAGMAVSLGRIRIDVRSVSLFLLVNNLIRGAAGNCLLTAELAFRSGYLI